MLADCADLLWCQQLDNGMFYLSSSPVNTRTLCCSATTKWAKDLLTIGMNTNRSKLSSLLDELYRKTIVP